jgi:hypothetical protein
MVAPRRGLAPQSPVSGAEQRKCAQIFQKLRNAQLLAAVRQNLTGTRKLVILKTCPETNAGFAFGKNARFRGTGKSPQRERKGQRAAATV